MLVGAITGIQYRYIAGKLGGGARRTFLRMTHHYRIDVSADNRNGIGKRFALLPSDVLALSEKPTTLAPGGA